jgi:carboxyl-terminal processing protease
MSANELVPKTDRWTRIFAWIAGLFAMLVLMVTAPVLYLHFKNHFVGCAVENRAARVYLLDALDIMQELSINTSKLNWPKIRETACEFARLAKSPAETYPALNGAIGALMDFHSFMRPPASKAETPDHPALVSHVNRLITRFVLGRLKVDASEPSQGEVAAANALPDSERYTVERHGFAMPDQRIGYLSLDGFTSGVKANELNYATTLAQSVDKILPDSQCGIILDLRRNMGGNMHPQFLGLHRLFGQGNVMGMKEPDSNLKWFSTANQTTCFVSASSTQCTLRLPAALHPQPDVSSTPVAVLLSQKTGSSAEAVALGFVGRPNAKTFGHRSYGATTMNAGIYLRDGMMLFLAVSEMTDRTGKTYPTHIVPDVPTTPRFPRSPPKRFEDLEGDQTAQAAMAWLQSLPGCKK